MQRGVLVVKKFFKNVFVSCALAIFAIPASATTLSYMLEADNGTQFGSGPGNAYEFVDQGVVLEVSAWANLGSEVFQVSTVTQYSRGLGACNPAEGSLAECADRGSIFGVDNFGAGQQDWLLLYLPETVNFNQVVINSGGGTDRDVTFWIGDLGNPAALSGAQYGDLAALGLGNAQTVFNSVGDGSLALDLGGQTGNVLLIGARLDDNDDRFLLSSLTATIVPLPPAAWLFASALGFLVARRQRH